MQLNVSTCYAMQIMVYLARNKRTVSSTELSGHLQISQRYILQIAGKLRDSDLIITLAGVNGGCKLKKEPSNISAYDIIALMEGDMSIPECLARVPNCGEPCKRSSLLDTLNMMKDYLETYLKTITFDKLADMDISGNLSEILGLVGTHIEAMKHKN